MTLLWNDIPISPRLFFLPLAELREHIPPRLLRLLCCRHPRGLLGSVLLMDERDLLDMPHFGLTFLSQLVAAVAAIEAQHGGQDFGGRGIAARARALVHYASEFNVPYRETWRRADGSEDGRLVYAPTFRQVGRFQVLAANAWRAGAMTSAETYRQTIALLPALRRA